MSLASNATDEQVGTILEAIQVITPEIVEQAVAYQRVIGIGWGAALAVATMILAMVSYRAAQKWGDSDYEPIAVLAGFFACLTFGGFAVCACTVFKSYYAADYYAAECFAKLVGKFLGN